MLVRNGAGIEITDFQTQDKTSDTIKYIPDIHGTSYIMATFDVSIHSFCKMNTYFLNKPCIIFFISYIIPYFTIHCKNFN